MVLRSRCQGTPAPPRWAARPRGQGLICLAHCHHLGPGPCSVLGRDLLRARGTEAGLASRQRMP